MKKRFFIEKLDSGFIITESNKQKAIEEIKSLMELLTSHFLKSITDNGNNNISISFEIDVNAPTVKSK